MALQWATAQFAPSGRSCDLALRFDPELFEQVLPWLPILGHRAWIYAGQVLVDNRVMIVLEPAIFSPDRCIRAICETSLDKRFVPFQELDPTVVFAIDLTEARTQVVNVVKP